MQVGVILGGKSSAKVKQNALVALGSLATAHGKDDPAKVLGTIPAILTQVRRFCHRSSLTKEMWGCSKNCRVFLGVGLDKVVLSCFPLRTSGC